MTDREDHVRKTDQFLSKMIELWPVWALLATGTVTGINFYNRVNDLVADQKAWKATTEDRRSRSREDDAKRDDRLTRLEKDVEWIKATRERGR